MKYAVWTHFVLKPDYSGMRRKLQLQQPPCRSLIPHPEALLIVQRKMMLAVNFTLESPMPQSFAFRKLSETDAAAGGFLGKCFPKTNSRTNSA